MIRTLYRHRGGSVLEELDREQIMAAAKDRQGALWIDMQAPTAAEYTFILEETFQFHPLAIEDTIQDVHLPKLDNYGDYLYLVFHTLNVGDERMDIQSDELDVFLGANYLITIHDDPRPTLDLLRRPEFHTTEGLAKGPAFLLYQVLDRQIDKYIPVLDHFELRLEEIGDQIFLDDQIDDGEILNDILTAKSSALRMRRVLAPQREVLNRLAWTDYPVVPAEARIYFHDVYDHLARLSDLAESTRDLASTTIETYLALANNRMNEVMKVLTIIATIFIPLSFLASVYGMNFDFMPELHWPWAYPFMWLVFIGIVSGMFMLFRRRGWL